MSESIRVNIAVRLSDVLVVLDVSSQILFRLCWFRCRLAIRDERGWRTSQHDECFARDIRPLLTIKSPSASRINHN
jgi:hypothetical protein